MDPAVQQILTETKPGRDDHKERAKRFDKAYDIYNASEPRPQSLSAWQSKMRVPYARAMVDTSLVNMFVGKPRCEIRPRTPEWADNAARFQLAFDYYIDQDHLVEAVPVTLQQALVYGVTAGKTHWKYVEAAQPVNEWRRDAIGGVTKTVTSKPVVLRDGPAFEPWDVYDVWWDPNGRDVDGCAYVTLRSWFTKEQLLANGCRIQGDHQPNQCDGMYHNLDLLFQTGNRNRQETTAQERALGTGKQNLRKNAFEIWEVWRDDRVTVVGNQQILLRDSPNPHWHGRKPIVVACTTPDMFKLQGISETELVRDLQDGLWTIENMRMDNLHLSVMRGLTFREGGVTDPDALVLKPRFKWPVTDHDDVMFQQPPPLPPEAYRETEEMLSRMQLITGITPYISGADQAGADQNTATGVSVLSEVASRRLRFKAAQIHWRCWQRVFEQWGSDIQQFMDRNVWVRVVGEGGQVTHTEVTPQEIVGDYDFVLTDTEESLSRQQERGEALALLNALAPLVQAGVINPKPLAEKVARAFDFDNPAELINPAPPAMPPAAPHAPGAPAPQVAPTGGGIQPAPGPVTPGQPLAPGLEAVAGRMNGGQ